MNLKTPGAWALVALACTGCAVPGGEKPEDGARALVAARGASLDAIPPGPDVPLSVDAAASLALTSSPQARAIWARLGIAEGEVREALRIHNPTLRFLRLDADGGISQTTWSLSQPLLELLFTGYRRRQGDLATRQAMQQCAAELISLEAQVRTAFAEHAAAVLAQQVGLRESEAARLSAELAGQYLAAGNIAELALRREEAVASEAALHALRLDVEREQARSRLLTLVGRSGDAELAIDSSLGWSSALPAAAGELQQLALQQRLDLAALRAEVELRRGAATHIARWRWLPGVTLEAERESDTGAAPLQGGGVSVELPLFDTGAGRRDRARGLLALREAQLDGLTTRIHNDVLAQRAAVIAGREAVDLHARSLLQQRERIVQLTRQRADYMLVGSFDLIDAREQQFAAYRMYIDAVTRLVLAQIGLAQVLGGALPVTEPASAMELEDFR